MAISASSTRKLLTTSSRAPHLQWSGGGTCSNVELGVARRKVIPGMQIHGDFRIVNQEVVDHFLQGPPPPMERWRNLFQRGTRRSSPEGHTWNADTWRFPHRQPGSC